MKRGDSKGKTGSSLQAEALHELGLRIFRRRKPPESWYLTKPLGNLFILERQEDGTVDARLSGRLQRRWDKLYLGMEDKPATFRAYLAINVLLRVADQFLQDGIDDVEKLPCPVIRPDGTIQRDVERENAATRLIVFGHWVTEQLYDVFAPLKAPKGPRLEAAKKNAKKIMSDVIDKLAWELPHKSDKRKMSLRLEELDCDLPVAGCSQPPHSGHVEP